jgi:hypothetical protein
MLDVEDGLVEQLRDVRIMQTVKDVLAASPTNHEPEMAQLTQRVGNHGGLHPDSVRELTHRTSSLPQPPQDLHPTGRGQPAYARPRRLSPRRWLLLVHLDHAFRLGVGLARHCRFGAPAATADLLRVS